VKFVFQPVIDLKRTSLLGFEALARFSDGRSPNLHFNQARSEGRLIELEHQAIKQIVASTDCIPDGYLVTMNASGESIQYFSDLTCLLDRRLRWGLELNEGSEPSGCTEVRRITQELNVQLLVDDAGVAYATRERIMNLRPDIVKLDRSLVAGYLGSPDVQELTHSLLRAARSCGAKTLAEGVETQGDVDLVDSLGFDYAQGYFYHRGLPPADLAEGMRDLNRRVGIDVPGF